MPGHFTLAELEDQIGKPIVLLIGYNANTKQYETLTMEELPQAAIVYIVQWLNSHLLG